MFRFRQNEPLKEVALPIFRRSCTGPVNRDKLRGMQKNSHGRTRSVLRLITFAKSPDVFMLETETLHVNCYMVG